MMLKENIKITNKGISLIDKHGQKLSFTEAFEKGLNRIYNWWLDLVIFIVDMVGYCPFWSLKKLVYQLAGLKIGPGSKIHYAARFFNPRGVVIGKDTKIGEFAFLDGRAPLTIGDHTDIASGVLIYNSEHDIHSEKMEPIEEPVEIGDYIFIGPRAIILPGVKIGKGAVVAAGAVVTKDVPAEKVVAGVPAEVIGERKIEKYNYRLGRSRLFQ